MGEDSELDLLMRWRSKDRGAGQRLVKIYYPRIRRFFTGYVNEDDAQDLTNDTFRRVMTTKMKVDDTTVVRMFFFYLARRVLCDHLRKHYRRDEKGFDPLTHSVEDVDGVTPSQAVAKLDQHRQIMNCMRGLPVDTKALLELRYWHGLKANELASIFEVKPATIRTRLFSARKKLQQCLGKADEPVVARTETDGPTNGERELDDELTQELRSVGEKLTSGPETK